MTNEPGNDRMNSFTPGSGLGGVIAIGALLLIGLLIYVSQAGPGQSSPDPKKNEKLTCEVPATNQTSQSGKNQTLSEPEKSGQIAGDAVQENQASGLPKLLDLGTLTCTPCKMMQPVLEALRKEYDGKMAVEFINLSLDKSAGSKYAVRVIPLQIFYDPAGKELFRHVGYWSKEDILAKWSELGYKFE
ncbi:MAG: thioredoxin family protein [bacterium]